MGKEDEVRIGDKEFDIISIGDTYKHELSADERERLKEKKLEGKEELDAIVRHRKLNRIRTDVSGNVVFSKPPHWTTWNPRRLEKRGWAKSRETCWRRLVDDDLRIDCGFKLSFIPIPFRC